MKKFLLLALTAGVVFGAGLNNELIELKLENKILKASLERCAQELNATKMTTGAQETIKNKREIKFNEKIAIDDLIEFEFQKTFFAKQIKPSKHTGVYSYYSSKGDDTTMTAAVLKLKNLSAEGIDLQKIFNATLIYDNKFKYPLGLAEEEADGSNFKTRMFGMNKIIPLIKTTIYVYGEVPLEIEKSDKPLNIIIEIRDQAFDLKIR